MIIQYNIDSSIDSLIINDNKIKYVFCNLLKYAKRLNVVNNYTGKFFDNYPKTIIGYLFDNF